MYDITCNASGPFNGSSNYVCGNRCVVNATGFTPSDFVASIDYKYYYQSVKLSSLALAHNSSCKICYTFAIVALDGGNLSNVVASLHPNDHTPTHISFEATNPD